MNRLTGVIADVKNNTYAIIKNTPIKQFKLKLGTNNVWQVGVDPATKYTGIALFSKDKRFIVLLDCIRDKRLPNTDYYDDLYFLLKRLVSGVKVERIVTEKPFVGGKSVRTSEVLMALRGKIEMWVHEIPELRDAEFQQVYPNTWMSRVVNKSKGKNRIKQAGAVADDLCDVFPVLREYREELCEGDLDSFDAFGVIIGYEMSAYTADGKRRISGSKEYSHKSFVGYKWVSGDEMGNDFVADTLGEMSKIIRPEFLEYNSEYSFAENVMMATTNNDAIMSIIPANQLQQFQWKFGIDVEDDEKVLIMFAFRKGHFKVSECEYLKKRFEMNEEFGGS